MTRQRSSSRRPRATQPDGVTQARKGSIRLEYRLTGAGWAFARIRSGATVLETVWKWTLTYADPQTLKVLLRTAPSMEPPPDGAPADIDINVDAAEWCESLLALAEKLLRRHGIEGYRASWIENDFPLGLYLRLSSYRARRFKLGINRVGPLRAGKSRLANEALLLKRLAGAPRR